MSPVKTEKLRKKNSKNIRLTKSVLGLAAENGVRASSLYFSTVVA